MYQYACTELVVLSNIHKFTDDSASTFYLTNLTISIASSGLSKEFSTDWIETSFVGDVIMRCAAKALY